MRVKILLIAMLLNFLALTIYGQEVIVNWNFDDATKQTTVNTSGNLSDYTPDNGAGTISLVGGPALYANSGTYFATGYEGSAVNTSGWDSGVDSKYWNFTISTTGFANLKFSSKQRGSNTGPKNFKLQYSLNGTTWADVENGAVTVAADFVSGVLSQVSLPEECNDQQTLHLRLVVTTTVSVNGGTVASGGTDRLDDLLVTGESAGAVITPVITPASQNFYEPFDATITCSTQGATIYYTIDGTDPDDASTEYEGPISITETTTIKAIAYAAELDPSNIAVAVYTLDEPATTTIPYIETFDEDLGECYVFSVTGDTRYWNYYSSTQAASMNGFGSSAVEEDWLILPGVTLNNNEYSLKFDSWRKYGEDDENNYLKLYYSTDYVGVGEPADAVWTELTFVQPSTTDTWTSSGNIDLSEIAGETVYFAFKYQYETVKYVHWQIDNVNIGEPSFNDDAEILTFVLDEQTGPAVINSEAATIEIEVEIGTDISSLTPAITVSSGATISPESGVSQDFSQPVIYTVTAENGETEKLWTVTVTEEPVTTIYEIQYTTSENGDSPLIDQTVTTAGIVTSLHYSYYPGGTYRGYFFQSGSGAWNGVYVYNNTNTPSLGDSVVIKGKVVEFNGLTEISNVSSFTVVSTGNTIPLPAETTSGEANHEQWEGVLIKVQNATCTNPDSGNGMAEVNDGSGALKVDDDVYKHTFTLNVKYNITGVGHYSFAEYKILPRSVDDVEIATSVIPTDVNSIKVYPNPFTSSISFDNLKNARFITISNLIGQQLMKVLLNGESTLEIDTRILPAGIYLVTIHNQTGEKVVRKLMKR